MAVEVERSEIAMYTFSFPTVRSVEMQELLNDVEIFTPPHSYTILSEGEPSVIKDTATVIGIGTAEAVRSAVEVLSANDFDISFFQWMRFKDSYNA